MNFELLMTISQSTISFYIDCFFILFDMLWISAWRIKAYKSGLPDFNSKGNYQTYIIFWLAGLISWQLVSAMLLATKEYFHTVLAHKDIAMQLDATKKSK